MSFRHQPVSHDSQLIDLGGMFVLSNPLHKSSLETLDLT